MSTPEAEATANGPTHSHVVQPPDSTGPSFSSLAGVPASPPDPFAATRDFTADRASARDDPATVDFSPSLVPGYEIVEEIGRGGMGVVYKARHTGLNRPVALKMILAGSHAGPTERERFRREAQAVAALQHPHIVQIFEIGEANGHPYLALEYVDGGTLAQHCTGQPWPARDAAEVVEQLARAVHYAHTQGVIHRDLKPGNVLLAIKSHDPTGRPGTGGSRSPLVRLPKITDFGLAKRVDETVGDGATKTGAVMGTPSYISPEQASGKTREIGPGVDVYALGAILYELLTGRPPFRGETPLDTVLQVLNDDPVSPKSLQPNVPWDLQTICLKCLTKSPARRYPTALALADDLRRFLTGEPILARPLSAWGRGAKWARRHPTLAGLGLVTVGATIALIAVLSVAYFRVRDAVSAKEHEAVLARRARDDEEVQRRRAEGLAVENETARQAAVAQAEQLRREAERNRRGAYALQIARIAAMGERDPKRALALLDDPGRCPPDLRDFAWAYLHRLCQRDDRVYAEHAKSDMLEALAVTRDGAFVATAGKSGEIRVWDPRTGRTLAVLAGHGGPVHGLAFSPDGGLLASAGADGTARLWEFPAEMLDLARRTMNALTFLQPLVKPFQLRPSRTLDHPSRSEVLCVTFSPDGRTVGCGLADGHVRLWNIGGWRPSPADVAAAGGPGAVARSVTLTKTFNGDVWVELGHVLSRKPVRCLAFSPSGQILAAGGDDGRVELMRSARTGRPTRVLTPGSDLVVTSFSRSADPILAVAFTPDEKTLFSTSNGPTPTILSINPETMREDRRLIGHTGAVQSLAVSPDGQTLASGGADGTVRLWDVEEGRERATLRGHELGVRGVAFGANRRTVVSAGVDGTSRVWLTGARPFEAADLGGSKEGYLAASFDAAGGLVAYADRAGRTGVGLLDVVSPGRPAPEPDTVPLFPYPLRFATVKPAVQAVATHPGGRAVVGAADDSLLVWRVLQFRTPGRNVGPQALSIAPPVRIPTPKPVTAVTVGPGGTRLATVDGEGVRVFEPGHVFTVPDPRARPSAPRLIAATPDARSAVFFPAGDRLLIAAGSGLKVIDLTGTVHADLPQAHPERVEAVAIDPQGALAASADASGLVKVWRLTPDGGLVPQADLAGHTGAVTTLSFTPGGRTLASGGADRTVVLWDPLTGQERLTLTGHADQLIRVQFTADGGALWTVSRDGAVKRWRGEQPDPTPKVFPGLRKR